MARTPEYDSAEVLGRAGAEFASRGYEGASVSQLVAATGLQRGSLYGAFGSKAELFRASFAAAVQHAEDTDLITDLLIVALRERAALDVQVARVAEQAIKLLRSAAAQPISQQIYARLLACAGLGAHTSD